MKKQLIAFSLALMSMGVFAQKNELKAAAKAIKKQNFAAAVASISAAEALMGNMDEKLKAKFYFLKAQAFAGQKKYSTAANAFSTLFAYEKEIRKQKYTSKAKPMQGQLTKEVSEKALKLYNDEKDYKNAAELFYLTYKLSPKDTAFMYNAAVSATQAKELDLALTYYRNLKSLGYTGIVLEYFATNKETGEEERIDTKAQRNLYVKSGQYTNPQDKGSKSKKATIVKNIALILKDQGKIDEAVTAIKEARIENPADLNLLLAEAELYIKLEKMDLFGELMEQATKMDPTNPTLFFNLGVVNYNQDKVEEAQGYYKKAIELDPTYRDAYLNLGLSILNKRVAIVEEMNKSLNDFDKYDALEQKQKDVCNEALPYLIKADALKRTLDTVKTLLNIYDTIENDEKSDEFRALYKSMK
ncbi:MAG: tetratricopeptide repeat protein [Polaribacter sp.]|jgi:tetratricopeptide (TPR) repeat protein|nr:tetratricopeptide repeat protein [Polaribacter sp.]MDG1321040.1 tetratricopeptide repeat protein [Polaribacter sp.]